MAEAMAQAERAKQVVVAMQTAMDNRKQRESIHAPLAPNKAAEGHVGDEQPIPKNPKIGPPIGRFSFLIFLSTLPFHPSPF